MAGWFDIIRSIRLEYLNSSEGESYFAHFYLGDLLILLSNQALNIEFLFFRKFEGELYIGFCEQRAMKGKLTAFMQKERTPEPAPPVQRVIPPFFFVLFL